MLDLYRRTDMKSEKDISCTSLTLYNCLDSGFSFSYLWCNHDRRWKRTRRRELKTWMKLSAFQRVLILLEKVYFPLFSLQLWANSKTDWAL